MKGILYANPIFIPCNVRQSMVLLIKPLVAYDYHRLYLNNACAKWQGMHIVNCAFSEEYRVLLVLTEDCRMHVFTEQLEEITILANWENKYVVGFEILQELGVFLLIGTNEIDLVKSTITSNVKRTKFLSSMKFSIRKDTVLRVKEDAKLKWNKGYGYSIKDDLLYVWSLQDIHFYKLSTLQLRTKNCNLTNKENSFTVALFSDHYKYTVAGSLSGSIKVWRLPINANSVFRQSVIHTFTHHTKEIEQILPGADEKSFVSCSKDLHVCFLSLQTFELLRSFWFSGEYSKIFLRTPYSAFAFKDNSLGELNYGKEFQFVADLSGPIIYHNKTMRKGKCEAVQLTLGSNLGLHIQESEFHKKQLNKTSITNIYPPLKATKNLLQIVSCPYDGKMFLLFDNGELFKVSVGQDTAKVEESYDIWKTLDSGKHQFKQSPCVIKFFPMVPPRCDSQIVDNTPMKDYSADELTTNNNDELIAIGCSRGSIIFLPINDLTSIYARISYHRETILNFQFVETNQREPLMVSFCAERYLKFVTFKHERSQCLLAIFCGQRLITMNGFDHHLAVILTKGYFQIIQISCINDLVDQEPQIIPNPQAVSQDGELLSFDNESKRKLIVTGWTDNKIKIWSYCKVLIYKIVLDADLNYCFWTNDLELLVLQNYNLLYMRHMPLRIKTDELERVNTEHRNKNMDLKVSLSRYIQMISQNEKHHGESQMKEKRISHIAATPKLVYHKREMQSVEFDPLEQSQESLRKSHSKSSRQIIKSPNQLNGSPQRRRKRNVKTQNNEQDRPGIKSLKKEIIPQADLILTRKYIEEMNQLKQMTHKSFLPRLKPRGEDIFIDFMRQKLTNPKKLLTRRDITLNRIIMKNIIKESFISNSEAVNQLKLE